MADWQNSSVLGTLVYWRDMASEFLSETRHVEVWLPPGYDNTVPNNVRFFFVYGTETLDAEYGPTHIAVREWLLGQDCVEGKDFQIREYPGAAHNEATWRRRLDDQLLRLLPQ